MSDPLQELSVRQPPPEGTDVATVVGEAPGSFYPKSHRLIVLIHGFNNTHSAAAESYDTFRDLLAQCGVKSPSLTGQMCAVHWPGNRHLGFLSFLSYPTEIGPAIQSGKVLADYFANLRGPQGAPLEIVFVCHSLGSRVALELLRTRLEQGPAPHESAVSFDGVCLMAAAVPVGHVEDGRLARAARFTRTRVLYSRGDLVLRFAFPIGQTAAGDGFFPQAVGRFGHPAGLWSQASDLSPYGHSDYWRGGENDQGDDRSVREVAAFLGVPVALEIVPWQLIPHPLSPTAVTPDNVIAARSLEPRSL